MQKIMSLILALLMAALNGVQYVKIEEPPFSTESYYKGNQGILDFRQMYNAYYNGGIEEDTEIDSSPLYLTDETVISLSPTNFRWIYTGVNSTEVTQVLNSTSDFVSLGKSYGDKLKEQSEVVIPVTADTKLIFPANGTLIKRSAIPEGRYPTQQYTKGNYMSFYIKDYSRETGFRIMIGSMERWWYNIQKTEPEDYFNDDRKLPMFENTVVLADDEAVLGGTIAGIAGLTSIPESERDTDKAYIYLKIEKTNIESDGSLGLVYYPATIGDLYRLE